MVDVNNFVCLLPFKYIQVFETYLEACCSDWVSARTVKSPLSLSEGWQELEWFRQGSLESPLKHCTLNCPNLRKLQETGDTQGIFIPKETCQLSPKVQQPESIRISCDVSCNLRCKSCRNETRLGDPRLTKRILDEVEQAWGSNLKQIDLIGSGDPFFSKPVRNWLQSFDSSKYPQLETIHIHTNGQLLTPEMWNSMPAATKFINSIEFSVDAATKETYEKIRRGGKWETVLDNIKFVASQESVKRMVVSFVVQRDNYLEIKDFYELFKPIISQHGRVWTIGYNKLMKWGIPDEDFENINIFSDLESVKVIQEQLLSLDRNHVRTNIELEQLHGIRNIV